MRATIKTFEGTAAISAGVAGVMLTLLSPGGEEVTVKLNPSEAAMVAGELERGAWRAQDAQERAQAAEYRVAA